MASIDWKRVRDERVPPVLEDDPALAQTYAQLRYLAAHPAPEGNDPITGRPWTEIHAQYRECLLDEIEAYRWRKAGIEPTREMLEICREWPTEGETMKREDNDSERTARAKQRVDSVFNAHDWSNPLDVQLHTIRCAELLNVRQGPLFEAIGYAVEKRRTTPDEFLQDFCFLQLVLEYLDAYHTEPSAT